MVIRTGSSDFAGSLALGVKFRQTITGNEADTSWTNTAELDFDVAMSFDSSRSSSTGSESEGNDFPTNADGLSFSRQSTEFVEGGLNRQSSHTLEDTKAPQPNGSGAVSSPSSPNRARMRNKFYKIKMCHFAATGACKKPHNCSFAHTLEELLPMPDLRNTKTCPNMLSDGTCEDQHCRFAHAKDELRVFRQARELAMQREQLLALNGEEAEQEPPLGATCCVRNTFLSWGPATLTESLQLQRSLRRGSSLPDLGTAERHSSNAEQRAVARMRLDSNHALLQRLGEDVRKLRSKFPAN